VFDNDFTDHALPEIRSRPVEDLVLQLKSMFIDNVENFPFPTPPDPVQIETATKKLMLLGMSDHD
jgi:ATP-dependent RNA helicase DHX37/DHR1